MDRLTRDNPKSWLQTVWSVLDEAFDEYSHNGASCPFYRDEEQDEVKTAMAWIAEELGVDPTDPDLSITNDL